MCLSLTVLREAQIVSHLCLSNMEVLIAVVDDSTVLAAGSDVANTLNEKENEKIVTAIDDHVGEL